MVGKESHFKQEFVHQTEHFITKEIAPFDNIWDFGKKIDPKIIEKPFDLAIAELNRISFELNQINLKKSPTIFDLNSFEINQYNDFLIAKNLYNKNVHILKQKQGYRVSFVNDRFIKNTNNIWQGYCLTNNNKFVLNEKFSYLDPSIFGPENLSTNGKLVKSDKRNIFRLKVGKDIFYVKSSNILLKPKIHIDYYDMFEHLPEIVKLSSKIEAERFLSLFKLGINIPTIIGYSTNQNIDCLVVKSIDGYHPNKTDYLKNRFNIKEQDIQILAALSTLKLEKIGFDDYDDKIIRNGKLYLIDVDECVPKEE